MRQLTIVSLGAQRAMLEAFRAWLSSATVLVCYNGRCYEAPLLATRYDWHACAIRGKGSRTWACRIPHGAVIAGLYENCQLATIRRRVLHVVGEDDLPGAEAPAAWLAYLRSGSAQPLRRVLAHNL